MSNFNNEHSIFSEIENYLSNSKKAIQIQNFDSKGYVKFYPNPENKKQHASNWQLQDITNRYNSIRTFFKSLFDKGMTDILISFKNPNGTTYLVDRTERVNLIKEAMLTSSVDSGASNSLNGAPNQPTYQKPQTMQMEHNPMQHMGGLGAAAAAAGLGFNDLVDLKSKAQAYDTLSEDYKDLKDKVRTLEMENKELDLQSKTNAKLMELALKEAEVSSKGFFESDAVKTLISQVPTTLALLMEQKAAHGNHNQSGGLNSSTVEKGNTSEAKQELIDFIKSADVTDEVASTFYNYVLYHLANTPEFREKLQQLINDQN